MVHDIIALLKAVSNQTLNEVELEIDSRTAATVMLVSGGYPETYEKGKIIKGFDEIKTSYVFHAGAKHDKGEVITSGGRVMAITSFGEDFKSALKTSYQNIDKISFDKMNFRKDIGFDL